MVGKREILNTLQAVAKHLDFLSTATVRNITTHSEKHTYDGLSLVHTLYRKSLPCISCLHFVFTASSGLLSLSSSLVSRPSPAPVFDCLQCAEQYCTGP